MKLSNMAVAGAIAILMNVGTLSAADNTVQQVSHCAAAACDCGAPVCGCETAAGAGCDSACGAAAGCDSACGAAAGCDSACGAGCDSACGAGCDSACGAGCDSGCRRGCGLRGRIRNRLDDCCHGEQWSLFGNEGPWTIGGWTQMGAHDKDIPLFNQHSDRFNLHQQWFYVEKAIDTSCGFDIGGRFDYVYGVDAQDTQAFGINNDHWDNGWDRGIYGHAMPQLYMEAGYGDWSVKVGHFYTIIGYEVVTAPDNFFYSHAYTMYNSEPFTHTGMLSTYNMSEDIDVFAGYVMGWDSGFEDNGDAFLGGFSAQLTDTMNVTYAMVGGRFATAGANDEQGYMHSVVTTYNLSDKLTAISQTDLLDTETSAGAGVRDTIGYNQYLLYQYNDCWGFGGRFEWYENEGVFTNFGDESDIYALTLGLNYKPTANFIVRPEVRFDWVENRTAIAAAGTDPVLENNDDDQTTVGFDAIFLF